MAIGPTLQEGRVFSFRTADHPKDEILVQRFEGRSALSQPYEFRLRLVTATKTAEAPGILRRPAVFRIKQPVGPTPRGGKTPPVVTTQVHGIVSSVVHVDEGAVANYYDVHLVPRLWLLSLNSGSRIFQGMTVPQIVEDVLKSHGLTAGKKPGDGGDYLFLLGSGRTYPVREYVLQYQESDLQFIQRLMEHEGICYYFDHSGSSEMVLFGDVAADYDGRGVVKLPWRPFKDGQGGDRGDWFLEECVHRFMFEQRVVQTGTALKDYNYRTPTIDLAVSKSLSAPAASPPPERAGKQYEYGDHYRTAKDGKELAEVRDGEILCRERRYRGASNCKSLNPGALFELTEHGTYGARYVPTEVLHEGEQDLEMAHGGGVNAKYRNAFFCLPSGQAFRPERTTPRPRIPGAITAVVDAAGDGTYAELDDQGRYRVRLLLDPKPGNPARASRAVRMAQPYAGAAYGFHFPLHKGTEVLLLHVNGDPDRPVLASALYTPSSPDVVRAPNQTQGVLKSAGENELRFEDLIGNEQVYLHATKDWVIDVVNDKTQDVGHDETLRVKNDRTKTVGRHQSETIGENKTIKVGGNHEELIDGNMTLHVVGNEQETVDGNRTIQVNKNCSESIKENRDLSVQVDYTIAVAQNMLTQVTGDKTEIIKGNRNETVKKDKTEEVKQELVLTVGKDHTEEAKETRTIKAKKIGVIIGDEIMIKTGKAEIVMKKNGDISIKGGLISIEGTKDVKIKGKNVLGN